MFFTNEKDYKTAASGLRRELKALGLTNVSHNQVLDLLARSMGHSSISAMKAAQPASGPVSEPAKALRRPYMQYAYDEEAADIAEREEFKGYRLFNSKGQLDLAAAEGEDDLLEFVNGLTIAPMGGTLDDVWYCVANVNGCRRNPDGSTDFEHEGSTDVNWDGQKTRADTRGIDLWSDEDGTAHPEDSLVLVKQGHSWMNLLSEEVLEDESYGLRQRDILIETCERYIRDKGLVAKALQEMDWDDAWGGFGGGFAEDAEDFGTAAKGHSALGQAQYAAGFAMHLGEFKVLRERLMRTCSQS